MKKILVLVDFTDTAEISLNQAISIAKEHKSSISVCHVNPSILETVPDELMERINPYATFVENEGIASDIIIGHGDLFHEVQTIVKNIDPELVVVGTHGKVGIKQQVFGSSIYKLVKGIHAPTIVVSDKTKVNSGGFKKVMLPVAPNKDYLLKVKQTCNLLATGGEIIIFAIIKPGVPLLDIILENIEDTKRFLERIGVKYSYQQIESKHYSIGYARDTLDVVSEQKMDLISIMTKVSEDNLYFGSIDKENLILNDLGVPVLCANH